MEDLDILEKSIVSCSNVEEIEKIRIEIFGKKGVLAKEFAKLATLSP